MRYLALLVAGTAGFAVGSALALLTGPSSGYPLTLACALAGALTCTFACSILTFGITGNSFLADLFFIPVSVCYSIIRASLSIGFVALSKRFFSKLRR